MVRAKTVSGGSSRGAYINGTHRGLKGHASASTRNQGFDGPLTAPHRQTANIVRQPVTLVHSTSLETKAAPANVIDAANLAVKAGPNTKLNRAKPRQMFWSQRLANMRPFILRPNQAPDMAAQEPLTLPNRITLIGPHVDETSSIASLACFLQNPSLERESVGQMNTKKTIDNNAGIFVDPKQPLIQAVIISDQDVLAQERRVLDARRRLEEALKHFG